MLAAALTLRTKLAMTSGTRPDGNRPPDAEEATQAVFVNPCGQDQNSSVEGRLFPVGLYKVELPRLRSLSPTLRACYRSAGTHQIKEYRRRCLNKGFVGD